MRALTLLLLVGSVISSSASAAAKPNVVCMLQNMARTEKITAKVVLGENGNNAYTEEDLRVGQDAFGFTMNLHQEDETSLNIEVVYSEMLHVEDEIDSKSWSIDLEEVEARKPILVDTLAYKNKRVATFMCFYNKK